MITQETIAKKCNVSRSAVCQVLKHPNHPEFSADTRERILCTARELNYLPNTLGKQLRKGKTHLLSLIIPWNVPELMDAVERTAHLHGFATMVQFTPEPDMEAEKVALKAALERRVDGIIWMPYYPIEAYEEFIGLAQRSHTRLVLLESDTSPFPESDMVDPDMQPAAESAARHVARQGYRKIIHVTFDMDNRSKNLRSRQIRQAAEDNGLDYQLVLSDQQNTVKSLLENGTISPTEGDVFFAEEWFILDILNYCKNKHITVPHSVGLVTLWDLLVGNAFLLSELISPSISTIRNFYAQLGQRATELLIDRLEKNKNCPQRIEKISMEFTSRESTARNEYFTKTEVLI